jgi:hypothetical protein
MFAVCRLLGVTLPCLLAAFGGKNKTRTLSCRMGSGVESERK